MSMKRFGVWNQQPTTAHIKTTKLEDGTFKAHTNGHEAVASDENRAIRLLSEKMEEVLRKGQV